MFTQTIAFFLFAAVAAQAQNADVLLQQTIAIKTGNLDSVLKKTEDNVKVVAENFHLRLDGKTKVVSGPLIGGTQLQPVYQVTVKKCVFLFCQTIDLDAEFTLQKTPAQNCSVRYNLIVDLQRSSPMLTDLYSFINTSICVQKTAAGANVGLNVVLLHAPNYQTGAVQRQAFELISLQGQSILEAFQAVMKLNGAQE